jgi:hypothetical protein
MCLGGWRTCQSHRVACDRNVSGWQLAVLGGICCESACLGVLWQCSQPQGCQTLLAQYLAVRLRLSLPCIGRQFFQTLWQVR